MLQSSMLARERAETAKTVRPTPPTPPTCLSHCCDTPLLSRGTNDLCSYLAADTWMLPDRHTHMYVHMHAYNSMAFLYPKWTHSSIVKDYSTCVLGPLTRPSAVARCVLVL